MPEERESYRWGLIYEFLLKNKGRLVTVKEMVEACGLDDTARNAQIVRYTLKRVRQEARKSGLSVLNVLGEGYRLEGDAPQGGPVPEEDAPLYGGAQPDDGRPVEVEEANGAIAEEAERILDEVLEADGDPDEPSDYEALYEKYGELAAKYGEIVGKEAKLNASYLRMRSSHNTLALRVEELTRSLKEQRALIDQLVTFAEGLEIRVVGGWKAPGGGSHRSK